LHGRIVPAWLLTEEFFDTQRNRNVRYHELCPQTPLLLFNHYWEGVRDHPSWPATKPLYLMPNIEMYELEAKHYRQSDVILCKTLVCYQLLTAWFNQEGNPRLTRVLYTRFVSSDVAANALETSGLTRNDSLKNFEDVVFTHTAGTRFVVVSECVVLWRSIIDC
jgi:hypothetical protein